MKLSSAAAYAVHAVLRLTENPAGSAVACHKLAEQSGMPERFLLRILQDLGRYGILQATRGSTGGFTLTQRPDEISLLDVIEAVEGAIVTALPTKGKFPDPGGELLFGVLQRITEDVRHRLDAVKLSDLLEADVGAEVTSRKKEKGASNWPNLAGNWRMIASKPLAGSSQP